MDFLPSWTKAGSWTLGRDPLGMQATSVRLYRNLVPGLTNVTNRLRYYSYYCWVVQLYEQIKHSKNEAEWKKFIRRAEATYALACFVAEPNLSYGLAGGQWASTQSQALTDKIFDLKPHTDKPGESGQYLKASRGNFGQFYIASMIEVGLLEPSHSRIPLVSKILGRQMADAFKTSVGIITELIEDAIVKGVVHPTDLKKIGNASHPSKIPVDSEEMMLLRDYLLAKSSADTNGTARRDSAWLMLDLINRGVTANLDFRRAFYNREMPGNLKYEEQGTIIDRWQAFQANEFSHIALECLLNGLLKRLALFPDGKEPADLIANFLKNLLEAKALSTTFDEFAHSVADEHIYNEESMSEAIRAALSNIKHAEDPLALKSAINLIATLWVRWAPESNSVRKIITHYAKGGKSLAGVLDTLDLHAQSSVAETLSQMIRRHIISDHLAIAGHKLAGSGTFTYHFTLADGLLADGQLDRYDYTNPRLSNLLQFLQDAQFCDDSALTSDGRRFLDEYKPV